MRSRKERRSPKEATVRVGGAVMAVQVLREFGLDPVEVLRSTGIDPALFDDPDNLMSYAARGRLFERCAVATGCPHFGLLVGQRMNLHSLGLVGVQIAHSPTVGHALRSLTIVLHLHSRGSTMDVAVVPGFVVLSYAGNDPNALDADQVGDGSVAMMLVVMRTLCGTGFEPIEARFAHREPIDVRPYRRFFQSPLRFDAEQYALVFSSDYLDVRPPGADAEMQHLLQKHIDALEVTHREDFTEQVRRAMRALVLTSRCKADVVAALFAMHTRTLERRLEARGTSFQELVDECRHMVARQLLEDTSLDVGEIAVSLGFARGSTFSRAFRRWSGTTPARWRTRVNGSV